MRRCAVHCSRGKLREESQLIFRDVRNAHQFPLQFTFQVGALPWTGTEMISILPGFEKLWWLPFILFNTQPRAYSLLINSFAESVFIQRFPSA